MLIRRLERLKALAREKEIKNEHGDEKPTSPSGKI